MQLLAIKSFPLSKIIRAFLVICLWKVLASGPKGLKTSFYFLLHVTGANIYVKDMNDKNVLHLAIEENNNDTLILLFGTEAKRLIDAPDKEFKTPLHFAAQGGNIEVSLFGNAGL